MFTTPCVIRKNTPELREKLEELGYNQHPSYYDGQYLYLNRGFYHTAVIGYSEEIERMIDCGTNEELFLALAALRDDEIPDYQWFVWNDIEDEGEKFKQYIPGKPWQEWWWLEVHKASVEEIIEHFKIEK